MVKQGGGTPAAMFPRGELAVSPDRGSNQLWIEGERLCAYMGRTSTSCWSSISTAAFGADPLRR